MMRDQKRALVFLHYFGGSDESWKFVIHELSDDFECVAFKLPGFGGTASLREISISGMAEYVRDRVKALEIEPYVLIGHSMGGKIALQVALDADPGEISQLILVAPSPPDIEPMPGEEKKRMLNHPNREEAENTVRKSAKRELAPEVFELGVRTQIEVDPETWRWWICEGMNDSIAEEAAKLTLPISILVSDEDPVITPEVVKERIVRSLPNADLRTIEGAGHLLPLEAPEELAREIRRSLKILGQKVGE